jgi:acyl-CoA thioester hydrolase
MQVYEYKLTTRHSELDSSLHVNNANYLRYLEEARVHMMETQNFPINDVHTANVEMILYKYVCHYKQQVLYPEKLTVRSKQIQTKKIRGILRQENI